MAEIKKRRKSMLAWYFRLKQIIADKWIPTIKNFFHPQMLQTVVSIDTQLELVHFFVRENGGKSYAHKVVALRSKGFDDKFYKKLGDILTTYREEHPTHSMQKVSVILPDQICVTDTVNIPVMQSRAMNNALQLAINSLHKNCDEMAFTTFPYAENRHFATFGVLGVKESILTRLIETFEASGVSIGNITYSANCLANGVMAHNPKAKNNTFLLMDIKEDRTKIALVFDGKTMGYFSLPFGYAILSRETLSPEDMVFDHSAAELLVLNAKERAKAKQLTLSVAERMNEAFGDLEIPTGESSEDSVLEVKARVFTSAQKKGPRKLPKYMLRPEPTTPEGFESENFRIFVKWALDIMAGNLGVFGGTLPKAVFVNMPTRFDYILDTINEEATENGTTFYTVHGETEMDPVIARHLQLWGGFYVKQYNHGNNF